MALDASVGTTTANSYVTIAECEAYFEDRIHAEAFTSSNEQDQAAITATQMLDWYCSYKGQKTYDTQALEWPRIDVVDKNGLVVTSTTIPARVKTATFELMLIIMEEDRTADSPLAGIAEASLGPLKIKSDLTNTSPSRKKVIPDKITAILSGLLFSASNSMVVKRLIRG